MKNTYLKLVLAICIVGFSVAASARDRDFGGGWRLGNGHDHYGIYRWDGRGYKRMPGSATDVGDGWVIGTDRRNGGYGIYRWSGRNWQRVNGGAVRIGGTYEQPWVINNRGQQFFWNGYDWDKSGRRYGGFSDDRRYNNSFSGRNRRDNRRRSSRGHW
tara:strand:- start:15120 stop:15593 length:474 start_codon:yes stop_codon:yes gene_type:complete